MSQYFVFSKPGLPGPVFYTPGGAPNFKAGSKVASVTNITDGEDVSNFFGEIVPRDNQVAQVSNDFSGKALLFLIEVIE